jgi:hypothetical protein
MCINDGELFIPGTRLAPPLADSAKCDGERAKQHEAFLALAILLQGSPAITVIWCRCAALSSGSSCASSGGEVTSARQSPLMRVQENQQIAPLPCCFGDEAQVVRNMVIYTLMLPAILGCRYIPM